MKSPVSMIEDIAAQISEGRILLENIYRESEENEKTDCSIACLLRSLDKTIDNAYSYASQCSNTKKNQPALPSEPAVGSTTTQQAATVGATNQFTIGARIQIARDSLGMSEDDLAEKLDIHPGDVLTWEDGADQPLAGMIIPLANALKCDPIWLLTGHPVDVKPAPPAPVNVMKGADLANIGVRIESRRNYIEMSLNKLAEEIDTSGAMILEWETGKAIPHSDYIDKLAKALNTTVTWLMTGKHINAETSAKNSTGVLLGFWKAVETAGLCGQKSIDIALPWKERVKEAHEKAINNLGNIYFNEINRQAEEVKKQRAKMVKPEMLFITVKHNVPAYYNDKDYSETGKAISDALVNYTNRLHNDGYEPWTTSMEEVVTEDNTYITIQRGICNRENELPLPKVERMNLNRDGTDSISESV